MTEQILSRFFGGGLFNNWCFEDGIFFIIILLLLPQYTGILPLIAFIGGAFACILVFIMAYKYGIKPG